MIVVLSRSDHPEDVVTAFTRGASGYLLKGINGERLASTLRGAYRGEPPLSRSLVPYLVDEIRRGSIRRITLPSGAVTLTPREWEVGQLLRRGSLHHRDRRGTRRLARHRAPARRPSAQEARREEPRGRGRAAARLRPTLKTARNPLERCDLAALIMT